MVSGELRAQGYDMEEQDGFIFVRRDELAEILSHFGLELSETAAGSTAEAAADLYLTRKLQDLFDKLVGRGHSVCAVRARCKGWRTEARQVLGCGTPDLPSEEHPRVHTDPDPPVEKYPKIEKLQAFVIVYGLRRDQRDKLEQIVWSCLGMDKSRGDQVHLVVAPDRASRLRRPPSESEPTARVLMACLALVGALAWIGRPRR